MELHMSKYKKNEDILSIMSNLQPNCCLKVEFQKVEQHAGGKWLIHDTQTPQGQSVAKPEIPLQNTQVELLYVT